MTYMLNALYKAQFCLPELRIAIPGWQSSGDHNSSMRRSRTRQNIEAQFRNDLRELMQERVSG